MGKKIIVAGAGHGGLVAAYYACLSGYDVTVYEKEKQENLGLEQTDSIHLDGFELSGIPVPEEYSVHRTPITFCVPGTDIEPITQFDNGESKTVEINRKVLYKILIDMAMKAGVKFCFEQSIIAPIVWGSRVVGIQTDKGDVYGDLIVDACGLYSPLRMNLPDFMHIEKCAGEHCILHTYRACFNRIKTEEEPAYRYKVSLLTGEECGVLWVITKPQKTDVFIGLFSGIHHDAIEKYLAVLKKDNPQIGDELLEGGKITDIPVRQPLSVLVADGYACVGDSAFMTVPVKGSGVGYAMRAGKMLAQCIAQDEDGLFDREHLWSYQTQFFDEIGSGAAVLAVIKSLFPVITLQDLEYALGQKLVSSQDLALFGSEAGMMKIITSLKPNVIRDKAKKLAGFQNLRKLLMTVAKGIARYKLVEGKLKEEYRSDSAEKWAEAYNELFRSLYKNEPDNDFEYEEKI